MLRILTMILIGALLLGCPLTKDAGNGGTGGGVAGNGGDVTDSSGTTDVGGTINVQVNNTGMSDPSKCNNLPAEQMADCLEQSMGG